MTNSTYSLVGSDGTNIVFDDVQYSVLRDSLEGFSTYPAEYSISQTPGVVGGRVINTTMGERELTLSVVVWGDGRAELEQRRRALVKALNPLLGHCRLYWMQESGSTYYLQARPTEDSPAFDSGTAPDAKYWQCTVTLTCADPCWHSSEETAQTLINSSVGLQLPFQVPFSFGNLTPTSAIINGGTAPAPMTITIMGAMEAPIVITNTTTGEAITISRNIPANDVLRIDTDRNDLRVTYTDTSEGTTINALSWCTVGSKFWQLAVGENQITFNAHQNTGGSAILTYRERMVAL